MTEPLPPMKERIFAFLRREHTVPEVADHVKRPESYIYPYINRLEIDERIIRLPLEKKEADSHRIPGRRKPKFSFYQVP